MKKTLSIVLCVLLVLLAVACSPESSTHVHEWEKTSASTATCEKDGSETWTCKICKESEVRPVEATGHTHAANVAGTVVTDETTDEKLTVTCKDSGLYTFRCTTCGKTFNEVVTPEQAKASGLYKNELKHVYLKDGKYNEYKKNDKDSLDNVQYLPTDVAEATMFTAKSKKASCKTCGDYMPDFNAVADETAEFKLINGTWVYESIKDGKAFEKIYLDITQKKETSGSVTTTAGYIISEYTEGEGWTTSEYTEMDTTNLLQVNNGKRNLYYNYKEKYYTITDGAEGYKVEYSSVANMEGAKDALEKDSEKDKGTIDFKEGHNHKYDNSKSCIYNLSSAEESVNIYCDGNFRLMTFLGVPYCDGTKHYVECSTCGISYYPVKCKTGTSGESDVTKTPCKLCGYTSKENSYYSVTVKRTAAAFASERTEAYLADAKTAYEDAATGISTSLTNEQAGEKLSSMITTLKDAKSDLEKSGEKNDSSLMKKITELLTRNESADLDGSLEDALAETNAKTKSDEIDETQVGNYKKLAELVEVALIGINTDPKDITVDTTTGGAVKALSTYVKVNSVNVETFEVPAKTILPLSYSKYTSFAGVEYNFASNTGWSWNSGEKIVNSESGYTVLGDKAEFTFVTKY